MQSKSVFQIEKVLRDYWNHIQEKSRDFSGGPEVKNLPSNVGDVGSILVGELRSTYLQGNSAACRMKTQCNQNKNKYV